MPRDEDGPGVFDIPVILAGWLVRGGGVWQWVSLALMAACCLALLVFLCALLYGGVLEWVRWIRRGRVPTWIAVSLPVSGAGLLWFACGVLRGLGQGDFGIGFWRALSGCLACALLLHVAGSVELRRRETGVVSPW